MPRPPFKPITWDNGTEFHGDKELEQAADIRCYFAYPHRPWQRKRYDYKTPFERLEELLGVLHFACQFTRPLRHHRPQAQPQAQERHGYKSPIERLEELLGALHFEC